MNKKHWLSLSVLWIRLCVVSTASCLAQVNGNGKVVKETRQLSGFKAISVKTAIHLLVSQGSEEKVVVETDENILPYLVTKVTDGKLDIFVKGSINNSKEMKVYVTVKQLSELDASSAAKVKSEGKLEAEDLRISATSGSSVEIGVSCKILEIKSSSGSASVITGSASSLRAEGSSGAAIVTSDLKAEKGELDASSGAALVVQVTKEVRAHASSGGQISVSGNPASRDTDSSSGGSVSFK